MNEREMRDAQGELVRVQHQCALWKKPLISNDEVPAALGIGKSSWQLMKKSGGAPDGLLIAGRIFYRSADLLAWIGTQKSPGITGAVEEEESA